MQMTRNHNRKAEEIASEHHQSTRNFLYNDTQEALVTRQDRKEQP